MERDNKKSSWSKFNSWIIRTRRVLFIEGKLMWLFFFLLAIAIYTPLFFNLHFSEQVQISATILQISAFIIIIMRLNEIHKFLNKRSFLKSFQMWFFRLFRAPQPPIFKGMTIKLESEISIEERRKEHEQKLRRVENMFSESQRNVRELQFKNTGRELVAVIWLIIASIINSFPNSLQLLPLY